MSAGSHQNRAIRPPRGSTYRAAASPSSVSRRWFGGLIEAPERGWTDAGILGAFAAGLTILAGYIAWERRCEQPMFDVSMLRNLRFSAASLSIAFVYFALMGVMYFLTSYL